MKTKIRRASKRTLAVVMSALIVVSCIIVGNITANAWTNPGIYHDLDTYSTWHAMTLDHAQTYYQDYYFKNGDADFYFKFNANSTNLGANSNGVEINTDYNKKQTKKGEANNCFVFRPTWLSGDSEFHKIRVYFDGNYSENADVWYTNEALTDISASVSAVAGPWTSGTSYTLTASTGGDFAGTKKYTFYVKIGSGNWTRIGSADQTSNTYTYKPKTADTYNFKVVVKDAGVVKGTNAKRDRTVDSSPMSRTVNAPANHALSVKVNNSSYGKAVASSATSGTPEISEAANGATVYVKYTERGGSIDASNCKVKKTDGTDVSTTVGLTHTAASKYFSFTMPDYDVIVNVKFKEKDPDADYYYNGYNNSGMIESYKHKRMTRATVNGKEFAYYKVTGRGGNGSDHYFTVIDESLSTFVVQLHSNLSYWNGCKLYLEDGSRNALNGAFPGTLMDHLDDKGGSGHTYPRYISYSPTTATKAVFAASDWADGDFHKQSNDTDISSRSGNTVYYVKDDGNGGKRTTKSYLSENESDYIEYHPNKNNNNSNDKINSQVYSIGTARFGGSQINSQNITVSSKTICLAKPSGSASEYYIVVYYPKTDYGTVNGTSVNNTNGYPAVVIYDSLPGVTSSSSTGVNIKVKDGAMTSSERSNKSVDQRKTLASIGSSNIDQVNSDVIVDSVHTYYDNTDGSGTSNTDSMGYQEATGERGKRLRVVTTLTNSDYYVKGWNINGHTYGYNEEPHEDDTDLDYVLDINIPSEKEIPEDTLEITPIYYLRDSSDTVTLYVDGYTKALQETGWGNTPYIYPFYGNNSNVENAFGSYPGQPMIFEGGKYQMQIPTVANSPLVDTNQNAKIRGITISNGYFDKYHADTFNLSTHLQTYDYDDFYKIYNEKKPDNIRFTFKYRTKKNNKSQFNSSNTSALTESSFDDTNGNGWEDLTNDWGDKCDLFGNPVPSDNLSATPLHVVSTGYYDNAAGQYGTEWRVYNQSNTLVTANSTRNTFSGTESFTLKSIVPSALILNDNTDSFAKSEYADNGRASYANGNATQIPQYKPMYTALETYRGLPVKITYEKNDTRKSGNWDYAKNADSSDASRCDGRWTYSSDGARMQSKIKVQFSNDNGSTWTTIDNRTTSDGKTKFFTTGTHANVGLDAYFTNTKDPNIYGETDTGTLYTQKGKYLTFNAEGAGSYVFYQWYMEKTNQSAGFNSSGRTEMTSSDVIVARFVWVTSGYLRIGHNIKGTAAGTSQTRVEIYHSDADTDNVSKADYVKDYTASDIDIPEKYITSNSDYKIKIYLKTTTDGVSRTKNDMFTCREFDGDGKELTKTGESAYEASKITFGLNYTAGTTGTARFEAQKTVIKSNDAVLPVTDLFSGTDQAITKLIFFSELDNGTTAKVKYQYLNRFGENRNLTFTTKYFDSDGGFPSTQENVSSYKIGNDATFMAWIKSNVPAIDDLAKDCTWNFSSIGLDGTNKILTVSATQNAKSIGYKISYNNTVGAEQTTGTYSVTDTQNNKVTSYCVDNPRLYNDPSSNFSYWNVYPAVRGDGEWVKKSNSPYARCYNRYFTITLPKNSIIEAVYGDSAEDKDLVSIGEATYTREVYNLEDDGAISDTLFADFVVNYMREDYDKLNEDTTNAKYYTGLILEINNKAKVSSDLASEDAIKAITFKSNTDSIKSIVQRIVDSGATGTQTYTVEGGVDERNAVFNYNLNNGDYNKFNRLDVPVTFANTSIWRQRVMKAYYYVVPVNDGTKDWSKWKISEPVYFCLNNIGNSDVNPDTGKITVVTEN